MPVAESFSTVSESASVEKVTPFQRALKEYIEGLSEKKRKRQFIINCQRCPNGPITADYIFDSIKKAEEKNSKQTVKRIIRLTLRPVVHVLKDYYAIIDALASADPMPTAIIWGSLKVVIDGADRFLNLFEMIKNELESLTSYLLRITLYEELYSDSPSLQDLLCKSYINILRFWSQVDKECDRCCPKSMLFAAASFSTTKIRKIVDDIKGDADTIEKLAQIIGAQKDEIEREAAERARQKADEETNAAQNERQAMLEWRQQQQMDRQVELYNRVYCWVCSQKADEVNEANQERYRLNKDRHLVGTCDWLISNPKYIAWLSGTIAPSIMWLHGSPGCGKSTLCSRVIQTIEESEPTAAIAFRFYEFDNPYSDLETLRLLAVQLFEKYWTSSRVVSEEIHLKTQRTSRSLENVQDLIRILVKSLPKTYFIFDGLDEECEGSRWREARTVLDFLVQLTRDFPGSVRLWHSSQFRPCIEEKLCAFSVFDIQDQVTGDVTRYLINKLDSLEVSEQDKGGVLRDMEERVEGNFLCASLMVEMLDKANSPKDLKQKIEDGPPNHDVYYRGIFDRFEDNRSLASKMFAMIAFARRPLRMKELREAIGLLGSSNPASLDEADLPYIRYMRKLFAPLIEIQEDCNDLDECTCRLFHSTVRDFLLKNPDVLNNGTGGPTLRITPYVIFDACLLYLSQHRYRKLLVRSDTSWVDASGELVDRHPFLLYSAKYWDKHLADVDETDPLRNRVQRFLTSSHFQTCIQVQSLYVDGQFRVFRVYGQSEARTYFRRVFPIWFSLPCGHGNSLWKDYRAFLHEWRYLLQRGSCEDPKCHFSPYAGEIDRCFWRALGSHSFMSKFKERYRSFTFQSKEVVDHPLCQCYEGVSVTGDQLIRLWRLVSRFQGMLKFVCERWSLAGNLPPVLRKTQVISTDQTSTNWRLFVKHSGDVANMDAGRATPVAFSPDCQFLRIGSQIFVTDVEGNYTSLLRPTAMDDHYPQYVEEFTSHGRFMAVASRRIVTKDSIYESGIQDTKIASFGVDFTKIEDSLSRAMLAAFVDSGNDGDDADSESSYWPSTDSSGCAYETWSEGSTEESDSQFEDDLLTPWTGLVVGFDESSSESSDVPVSESESTNEDEKQTENDSDAKSESSESDLSLSAVVGYGRYHADTSSDDDWDAKHKNYDYDSDGSGYAADAYSVYRQKKASTEPHNSIVVFDTTSPVPTKIFQFKRTLPFMIYGSPPVIHPSESLMVWPLSGGDILFADFLARTFFIRKLRPSTAHTRHIFMKCHFSPCGCYLHIASLEGQRKQKKGVEQPPLNLALLVVTYRLSGSKRTRSPPSLIYRTRIDLKAVESLSVSRLPFTLTWSREELYVTFSHNTFRVYRIRLFRANEDKNTAPQGHGQDALVPQKTIFLPNTARRREVYYFPPGVGNTEARVIIGSEAKARESLSTTPDDKFFGFHIETCVCVTDDVVATTDDVIGLRVLSPPIGCYLKEADLGGWVKSNNLSEIPQDLGIGKLDRRLERFNPDDDCDLEPYVF